MKAVRTWRGALAGAIAGLAVTAAGPCAAGCAQFSASSVNLFYNPLGGTALLGVVQPLNLTVTRTDTADTVVAQFADPAPGAGGFQVAGGPAYTIVNIVGQTVVAHENAQPLRPNATFVASFGDAHSPGGTRPVFGLLLALPPGQDLAAGVYNTTLDVQYRCYTGADTDGDDVQLQSAVLPVTITVPSVLSVNLAGGGLHGVIDFDQFQTPTKSANVQVRSTGPFTVSVSAEHNGKMVLLGTSGGDTREVPYTLKLDGQDVTLGGVTTMDRTGVGGRSLPLAVTAGDVSAVRAGAYKDTLTIVFTPKATL